MKRRRAALALASGLAAIGTLLLPVAPEAHAAGDAIDLGSVSITKTVTRAHLEPDGTSTPVDTRTVTLNVSQTEGLRGRQPVRVSWSGAHPTGGITGDPTGENANNQEYPFVLLECRGVDSADAPEADKLRPETCWTGTMRERAAADTKSLFGAWRLDRYATPAERTALVGVSSPLPGACADEYKTRGRWVHFLGANGNDYFSDGSPEGPTGPCGKLPPETVFVANASQPSNNQYAATGADGTGNTKFTTWTSEDNASLGCGGTVQCAIVAVPIMGISCDERGHGLPPGDIPTAAELPAVTKACRATGVNKAGSLNQGRTPDRAVTGSLWWSASNWRNRLTVPLQFAPLASVCDITDGKDSVDIYGSELMTSVAALWRPAFCLDPKRTPFKHVQLPEPQAANLQRRGNVGAAFVSRAPAAGFAAETVAAPVTLTGFSISYTIDGDDKAPYHTLRLTPRLIAKLLTASYPGILAVKVENEALSRNPLDMSADPEFQALNPGIAVRGNAAASVLVNLSSDSDVVYALTNYLNGDPETRDFLYGVPDPWGMVVNPAYKRIALPVANWPLLDDFEPLKSYATGNNLCLEANPVPIVPLIQSPTSRLSSIANTVQFAVSTSQLNCNAVDGLGAVGAKLVGSGRQAPGVRFVLGLTSLADATRYDLDSAALQTSVAPSAPEKFTDGTGRTFVGPTRDGLRTAASQLVLDEKSGMWTFPYGTKATESSEAGGYPGTMLVSMAVPTKGLPEADAAGYADLLAFAAGDGQHPGLDVGDLPPGYLPLTDENGLARQRDQLLRAVSAVRAQRGASVPALTAEAAVAPSASAAPVAEPVVEPAPTENTGPDGFPVTVPLPSPTFDIPSPPSPQPAMTGSPSPVLPDPLPTPQPAASPAATTPPSGVTVNLAATPRVASALSASLFPALLVVACVLGFGSALLSRRPRARP